MTNLKLFPSNTVTVEDIAHEFLAKKEEIRGVIGIIIFKDDTVNTWHTDLKPSEVVFCLEAAKLDSINNARP